MMARGIYEGSRKFNFFEIYMDVAIIYWVLSIVLTFLQRRIEKALSVYQ